MLKFSESRLNELLKGGERKRILVVGDLMVDRYLWGNVSRISPEAPVPIINIEDEEVRFGGAANVANNLIGLGAEPVLVGVVGRDAWGKVFKSLLKDRNLTTDGLMVDAGRPTTVKTRIIGNNQHIARVDRERIAPIPETIKRRLVDYMAAVIDEIDAIVIQDYNKGVIVPDLVHKLIHLANSHDKIIAVDPKFDNFMEFREVSIFKPNKKETEQVLAMRLANETDVRQAGEILMDKLRPRALLITLGEKGMVLFENVHEVIFMGTRTRKVADVSGAGDTVIATVTFALASGASMKEAVTLSNYAAGVVCEEVGVVPIERETLCRTILKNQDNFEDE